MAITGTPFAPTLALALNTALRLNWFTNTGVTANNGTIVWTLQWAEDASYTTGVGSTTLADNSGDTYAATGLTQNQAYYVRLIADDDDLSPVYSSDLSTSTDNDGTDPELSSAETDATGLLVTVNFTEIVAVTAVVTGWSIASPARTIDSISATAENTSTTIQLAEVDRVLYGDTAGTLSYDTLEQRFQDLNGNWGSGGASPAITNNSSATRPTMTVATVVGDGTQIEVACSETMAAMSGGGANGLTIAGFAGGAVTVSDSEIVADTSVVILTLSRTISASDYGGTLDYDRNAAGNPLAEADYSVPVLSFAALSITNEADCIPTSSVVVAVGTAIDISLDASPGDASAVSDGGITITSDGGAVTATAWSISGTMLSVTTSRTILTGETITTSSAGGTITRVGVWTDAAVTNNSTVGGDVSFSSGQVTGSGELIEVTLSDAPGDDSAADSGGVTVTSDGGAVTATAWDVTGSTLTLTLSRMILTGETVTCAGTALTIPGVLDWADTAVANNSGEDPAPVPTGFEVEAAGNVLTITLDSDAAADSGSDDGGFTIASDGGIVTVASWSAAGGDEIVLTLSRKLLASETLTLDYDSESVNAVVANDDGQLMQSFADEAVTNDSTVTLTTPPIIRNNASAPGASRGRALLLNRASGGRPQPGWYGEEYTPSTFAPLELPRSVKSLHAALFGSQPDDLTLNYRLQQYLQLMHAHPVADAFVRALDPRVAYRGNTTLVDADYRPVAGLTAGTGSDVRNISFSGTLVGDETVGRHLRRLQVSVNRSAETYTVLDLTNATSETGDLAFTDTTPAYVTRVPLTDTGVTMALAYVNTADTLVWDVTLTARPARSLPRVLSDILGRSEALDLLTLGAAEPYPTFRKLIDKGLSWPDKFAGVLLTLLYRLEEARTANA